MINALRTLVDEGCGCAGGSATAAAAGSTGTSTRTGSAGTGSGSSTGGAGGGTGASGAGSGTGTAGTGTTTPRPTKPGCGDPWTDSGIVETFNFGQFVNLVVVDQNTGQTLESILHAGLMDPHGVAQKTAEIEDGSKTLASAMGGMPLLDLARGNALMYVRPVDDLTYEVTAPVEPFGSGPVTATVNVTPRSSFTYKADLTDIARAELAAGRKTTVVAYTDQVDAKGNAQPAVLLNVTPAVTEVALSKDTLAEAIATRKVTVGSKKTKVGLDGLGIQSLLDGHPLFIKSDEAKPRLLRLVPAKAENAPVPVADSFHVVDMASFLASPFVLDSDGATMPVTLDATKVKQLLSGQTQVAAGGRTVTINSKAGGPALPLIKGALAPMAGGARVDKSIINQLSEIPLKFEKKSQRFLDMLEDVALFPAAGPNLKPIPSELPPITVSLFIPWTQTWTLTGYTRGRLVQGFSLPPGAEVTVELFTWDRTKKTLDRTTSTDTEQTFDTSVTTKDTDDVVKELASQNDFQAHGQGGISASYKPGVAEIKAEAQVGAETKSGLNNTMKQSGQAIHDQTVKASARVSQHRVSRVTETREFGSEERTTRKIRNPNMCHNLEFRFHEVRAEYNITTALAIDDAQLCALVQNPLSATVIDADLVRRNETAFRNSLLDTALIDGFEALRLLEAYSQAQRIIREQATALAAQMAAADKDAPTSQDRANAQASQTALADAQTGSNSAGTATTTDPADPDDPLPSKEEQAVTALLDKVLEAADALASITDLHSHWVMTCFDKHVAPDPVTLGYMRRFIFWRMVRNTMGSLFQTLNEFANTQPPEIPGLLPGAFPTGAASTSKIRPKDSKEKMAAAVRILACAGGPLDQPGLGGLTGLSDGRKEEVALSAIIRDSGYFGAEWDWAWWSGTFRDHGLYSPDDCGLPNLLKQLAEAMDAFNRASQAAAALAGFGTPKEAIEAANKGQDRAEAIDRLDQAFGLSDLANASERADALLRHFGDHSDYYRYTLFQALPPSEQLDKIAAAAGGNLPVGLFEPRVIAMNGNKLAVPLSRGVVAALDKWVEDLLADVRADLEGGDPKKVPGGTSPTSLPTPVLTTVMELGECSGCEEFIDSSRQIDLEVQRAKAAQEWLEAGRLGARLAGKLLEDPRRPADGITLRMDDLRAHTTSTPPAPAPALPQGGAAAAGGPQDGAGAGGGG